MLILDKVRDFKLRLSILENIVDDGLEMADKIYQNIACRPLPQLLWSNKDTMDIENRSWNMMERTSRWVEKKTKERIGFFVSKEIVSPEQSQSPNPNASKFPTSSSPTPQRINSSLEEMDRNQDIVWS